MESNSHPVHERLPPQSVAKDELLNEPHSGERGYKVEPPLFAAKDHYSRFESLSASRFNAELISSGFRCTFKMLNPSLLAKAALRD